MSNQSWSFRINVNTTYLSTKKRNKPKKGTLINFFVLPVCDYGLMKQVAFIPTKNVSNPHIVEIGKSEDPFSFLSDIC